MTGKETKHKHILLGGNQIVPVMELSLPPGGANVVSTRRSRVFALPFGVFLNPTLGWLPLILIIACAVIVAATAVYWVYRDIKQRQSRS